MKRRTTTSQPKTKKNPIKIQFVCQRALLDVRKLGLLILHLRAVGDYPEAPKNLLQ